MTHRPYDPDDAAALTPLLESIGRELEERAALLSDVEERVEALQGGRRTRRALEELRQLEGDASTQRRELRRCREELERLGCSVVGTAPLTVRIPTRLGDASRSRVWQHGQEAAD